MSEEIKDLKQELNEFDEEYVKLYEKYCNLRNEKKDLQQKVEQLEKENDNLRELEVLRIKTTLDIINERDEHFAKGIKLEKKLIELESIRKRMIEYIGNKDLGIPKRVREKAFDILNKGSESNE